MPETQLQTNEAETTTAVSRVDDTSPMALILKAKEIGATPEQVSQWMDLQERYNAQEARKSFFASMARFQANVPMIPHTRDVKKSGGQLMYDYAPLPVCLSTIRQTESDCGFMHRWDVEEIESGGVKVTCNISHIDGHVESSSATIPPTKGMNTNDAQDKKIIIEYGRRISLLNAYGLGTGGVDTDANTQASYTPMSDKHRMILEEHVEAAFKDNPGRRQGFDGWLKKTFNADSVADVPDNQFDLLKSKLTAVINEQGNK